MNLPQHGRTCDVWIDIECAVAEGRETVCSLFAKLVLPVRPIVGEPLTFWSKQGAETEFTMVTAAGSRPVSYIGTEIDSVSHHVHPCDQGAIWSMHVRCVSGVAASLSDARLAADFLITQHGFEIDPYGVNKLEAVAGAA
jgi:hypothetical protein